MVIRVRLKVRQLLGEDNQCVTTIYHYLAGVEGLSMETRARLKVRLISGEMNA